MRWLVRLANKNYKRTRKSCTHAKCGCSMVSMSLWFYHRFSSEISIKLDSMPWNVALCLFSFSSFHNGKCWKIHFVWVSNDILKYKESNCKNLRLVLILHFWEFTTSSWILLGVWKETKKRVRVWKSHFHTILIEIRTFLLFRDDNDLISCWYNNYRSSQKNPSTKFVLFS